MTNVNHKSMEGYKMTEKCNDQKRGSGREECIWHKYDKFSICQYKSQHMT